MRCFIAIELPKEIQKELALVQKKIPDAKMTLVKPESIHMTLKFLGELDAKQIEKAKLAMNELKLNKFKARLANLGAFPNSSFVRVVWVGIDPKENFLGIHNSLDNSLHEQGFTKDSIFESHATLARIKFIEDKKSFSKKLQEIKINPLEFEVKEVVLKKSTLTSEGPVYEDIFKVQLLK